MGVQDIYENNEGVHTQVQVGSERSDLEGTVVKKRKNQVNRVNSERKLGSQRAVSFGTGELIPENVTVEKDRTESVAKFSVTVKLPQSAGEMSEESQW